MFLPVVPVLVICIKAGFGHNILIYRAYICLDSTYTNGNISLVSQISLVCIVFGACIL